MLDCVPGKTLQNTDSTFPTFVEDDAGDLLLGRRGAPDPVALHQPVHLCQVLKGAVHSCGKLRNVVSFQDQLESDT